MIDLLFSLFILRTKSSQLDGRTEILTDWFMLRRIAISYDGTTQCILRLRANYNDTIIIRLRSFQNIGRTPHTAAVVLKEVMWSIEWRALILFTS